jgi:hypothetical protein
MFISNYEKHQLKMRIDSLEVAVSRLEAQIEKLKPKLKPPIFKTDEAPWGYKKDGTPRKRPGRRPYNIPVIKNEQPLPV